MRSDAAFGDNLGFGNIPLPFGSPAGPCSG